MQIGSGGWEKINLEYFTENIKLPVREKIVAVISYIQIITERSHKNRTGRSKNIGSISH